LAIYEGAVAAGAAKAAAPFGKIFKLGIVAGAHIAFGAYLAISVGGACPGIAASNPGIQKVRFDSKFQHVACCYSNGSFSLFIYITNI
jgi:formate/nitrite transporter FocA (FNT family)